MAGRAPLRVRLFVAVWPPAAVVDLVAAAVAALRGPDLGAADDLRWTAPERWHVTLRFLGDTDEADAVPAFCAAAALDGFGPATAVLGPAIGRFGRRVLHVPVGGLTSLAAAVTAATALVGEPPDDRRFAGHLTLARARPRRGADLAPLAGHAVSAQWPVAEVTLVASRQGRGGARYEVVARLPVEGPCPNIRSQLH